jgi:hypothetical protein
MEALKYWNVDSFEISTYKFNLSDRVNKTYKTSGSDNTELCSYSYNELGFRGDSITRKGFKVLSLGCSHTEGVGVNYVDTWPQIFCKYIPNGVNLNFGTGGRSNDFIARCLLTYYDYVKPDLVLIVYPDICRREIYTDEGGIEPFMPQSSWGYLLETTNGENIQNNMVALQNENSDFINWYKNHLLIKYFLESKGANWLWNGSMNIPDDYKEYNRFDGDFSIVIDKAVDGGHHGPIHNKKYAETLINYISDEFPHYIPNIKNLINL